MKTHLAGASTANLSFLSCSQLPKDRKTFFTPLPGAQNYGQRLDKVLYPLSTQMAERRVEISSG
jgi:hypothetical protein